MGVDGTRSDHFSIFKWVHEMSETLVIDTNFCGEGAMTKSEVGGLQVALMVIVGAPGDGSVLLARSLTSP